MTVVDLEEFRAARIAATCGTIRYAGAALSESGTKVVLRLPSGHEEELSGVVAIVLATQMLELADEAQNAEDAERDGGLFR